MFTLFRVVHFKCENDRDRAWAIYRIKGFVREIYAFYFFRVCCLVVLSIYFLFFDLAIVRSLYEARPSRQSEIHVHSLECFIIIIFYNFISLGANKIENKRNSRVDNTIDNTIYRYIILYVGTSRTNFLGFLFSRHIKDISKKDITKTNILNNTRQPSAQNYV